MFWYHKIMEILLALIFCVCVFNTIILIAVAATLSKMIHGTEEHDVPQKNNARSKSSKQMIDLPVVGPPTYDLAVFDGKAEPYTDGMERRLTPTKNWDGISQQ